MSDVTQILAKIESGNPSAAEQLLPLVYNELRRLAAARLGHEKPGQTLQATALVHDAFLRLVDTERAHEVYRRWLAQTRPAPESSPNGDRRPYWLLRPLKPDRNVYRLPTAGEGG